MNDEIDEFITDSWMSLNIDAFERATATVTVWTLDSGMCGIDVIQ